MIRKSFLSAVILVTAFCFTACGKPQTTNEIVTTSTTDTQVQTTPDALSTTKVEVTEQEVVAEPEVVEAEPEKENGELCVIIKGEYTLEDGDILVICFNEDLCILQVHSPVAKLRNEQDPRHTLDNMPNRHTRNTSSPC